MALGDKIKELRAKKKLSQIDLGKLANVHNTHIGKYENNLQTPSLETIKNIAKVLGVSVDYLINEQTENAITANFSDQELLEKFKKAEQLPEGDKELVKKFLDAFLMKNDIEKLVKN